MNVYWIVLLITTVLAVFFHNNKKGFVISTAAVHIFICGFRYKFMHGDLMKYNTEFMELADKNWFSDSIIHAGRNSLFYALNKFVANISGNNFQLLLFIITLISIMSLSIVIYRYSRIPLVSFLLWSCFGFYMFSFYSIKQTLAMAIVMFASIAIFEGKRLQFYLLAIIAGFIHLPAFVFLPAYEISRIKSYRTLFLVYFAAFLGVFFNRNAIVVAMADVYYDAEKYASVNNNLIGGKSLMVISLLIIAWLLCGLTENVSRITIVFISIASLLQLFSVYDNVFTRLADYYFQFVVLMGPCMLTQKYEGRQYPLLLFDKKSQTILSVVFVCLAVLFYYRVNLSGLNTPSPDNLILNFAFMWQVK